MSLESDLLRAQAEHHLLELKYIIDQLTALDQKLYPRGLAGELSRLAFRASPSGLGGGGK